MQALEIILAKEMKAFSSAHEYLIQKQLIMLKRESWVQSHFKEEKKTNRNLTVILWETW